MKDPKNLTVKKVNKLPIKKKKIKVNQVTLSKRIQADINMLLRFSILTSIKHN